MRFVLVPGGWQGGWVFDESAGLLRGRGHVVDAVTPLGLEQEPPIASRHPANLDDHIEQVVAVVGAGPGPIALVGHSYAGMIVAGVAARIPEAIAHVVFLDAYVPDDGDSCWSLTTDMFREQFVAGSRADGRWVTVPDGLDPRARPHPLPSVLQAIRLPNGLPAGPRRTYVSGGEWRGSPFRSLTARLRADPAWTVHDIPVGHNIARRDPRALADLLDGLDRDGSVGPPGAC